MMQAKFLALLLMVSIKEWSVSAKEFTVFPLLGPVVKIPSEMYALRPRAVLHCALSLAPGVSYTIQWIGPGDVGIIDPTTNDHYNITESTLQLRNGSELPGTTLSIHKLSYQDAGVYTCSGRRLEESASSWVSATIDLQLDLDLSSKFNETIVMATTADSTVELSCEMRAFIRPDSSLIWEGPDNQRLTGGTGKYQITFSNGSSNAAVNGALQLVPSRVSTLTVHDPEKSDQGVYTCSVMDSNKTIDLVITINDAKTTPVTTAFSDDGSGTEANTHTITTAMDKTTNPAVLSTIPMPDKTANPTTTTTATDKMTNPQLDTTQKVKSSSKSGLYYMTTAAVLMIVTSAGVLLQHFI